MRQTLLFFAALLTVVPLAAADSTAELLTAKKVEKVIQFTSDKSSVTYVVDTRVEGTLSEGKSETFAAPHDVVLTYKDYNPFKVTITSTEASVADPSQKALADFLDALLAFGKELAPAAAAMRTAAQIYALDGGRDCFDDVDVNALTHPRANKAKAESIAEAVDRWIRDAHGKAGIESVLKEINEARKVIGTDVAKAKEAQDKVAAGKCEPSAAKVAAAATLIAANKELLKTLEAFSKLLEAFVERRWDNNDNDLIFRQVASDPAQQKNVDIAFARQKYPFDPATNVVTATPDGELKRSLSIRRYRGLVPEVGVAVVYNELKYPKYSTELKDGVLVVKKEESKSNVDAALTLNMLCNCLRNDFLFPGFQLGVSKIEDYPGIMAGGVLRFAQPKQLSIGFGRMVTWYKELSKLEVGKKVDSQEDITKDLKRKRAPAAWYFAVQYTF